MERPFRGGRDSLHLAAYLPTYLVTSCDMVFLLQLKLPLRNLSRYWHSHDRHLLIHCFPHLLTFPIEILHKLQFAELIVSRRALLGACQDLVGNAHISTYSGGGASRSRHKAAGTLGITHCLHYHQQCFYLREDLDQVGDKFESKKSHCGGHIRT